MPRLIVNADDLGLTSGVNRAVFEAQDHGIVTSATLMANAPCFDEAVARLKTLPAYRDRSFSVGCHIVLVDGFPLSPAANVSTLLQGARFRKKLWKFAAAAASGAISEKEVETEAAAQIRKLQCAGMDVSHVDCHKHTHMFPAVLNGVLRAASAAGVTAIRNPFEPSFARGAGAGGLRAMQTAALRALYEQRFLHAVSQAGLQTTDGAVGVTATGALDAKAFEQTIRSLPTDGTYELVCHPGYNDAALEITGTRLLQSRETELQLLGAPTAHDLLRSSHVELINFWQLASRAESKPSAAHPMP